MLRFQCESLTLGLSGSSRNCSSQRHCCQCKSLTLGLSGSSRSCIPKRHRRQCESLSLGLSDSSRSCSHRMPCLQCASPNPEWQLAPNWGNLWKLHARHDLHRQGFARQTNLLCGTQMPWSSHTPALASWRTLPGTWTDVKMASLDRVKCLGLLQIEGQHMVCEIDFGSLKHCELSWLPASTRAPSGMQTEMLDSRQISFLGSVGATTTSDKNH